jgi:hypothetical protein
MHISVKELGVSYFMHIQYPISVNMDEEIGRLGIWGRLRVDDYRDGGGGKSARRETG